jgi:hypothetical protein
MCSGRAMTRALALVALFCCRPVETLSQDAKAYERRVDSLAKAYNDAQRTLSVAEESERQNMRRYDTVVVGPLRILTDAGTSALAREVAQLVLASLTPYGKAAEGLTKHSFVVVPENVESRLVFVGILNNDGTRSQVAVLEPDAVPVSRMLFNAVSRALATSLDPSLIHWLGAPPPVDTAPSYAWTNARIELLSATSTVARRCYAGDMDACKITLGLAPTTDPATQWFDAADRRRLIQSHASWGYSSPSGEFQCLAGSDSVCIEILRRHPYRMPGAPAVQTHRVALAQMAIALGGPGATERLLMTAGTPSERLAAAARLPADSLIRLWRQRVRDARIASDDMSVGIAASSLVWVLACAALALRSSRWR